MIKVKILSTGEIREVTRNVAFDLVDRKLAKVMETETGMGYSTRKMDAGKTRKYKVK